MTLRYPKDKVYDAATDYVKFKFYRYLPPFRKGGSVTDINSVDYYNTSGGQEYKAAEDLQEVLLYIPEDIQSEFATDWGDKSFTNVQKDLLRAGGNLLSGTGTGITGIVDSFRNASGRLPSALAQTLANSINALPGGIGGNTDLNTVLGGTNGIVLNPNVELLFNGFGLRNFDLTYKFTPRSEPEAKEIRKIIHTFKKASLPAYNAKDTGNPSNILKQAGIPLMDPNLAATANNNYISVPDLVQVQYMKGKSLHPYLPKWKMCAITGVNVNYTPDGSYATYSDGSPVATSMTIGFAETKLVFGDEISIDSDEAQY